jgi:hypothetical protein
MWFELLILALAIPIGLLITALTKDEMKIGRKYFKILTIVSALWAILFLIEGIAYLAYTFGFMLIVSFISLRHKI